METQQTLEADTAGSAEGQQDATVEVAPVSVPTSADVNQAETTLETLSSLTGRKYGSLDDAKKHLEGLNRLVGDNTIAEQREKAQLLDALANNYASEQGITLKEAKERIKNLVNTQPQAPVEQVKSEAAAPEVMQRLDRLERAEFLISNPEATPYIDKVVSYSKATGKSIADSYLELYGDVVKASNENAQADVIREEKRQAQVTASSSTAVAPSPDLASQNLEKYRKSGGKDDKALHEAMKERWNRALAGKK